MRRLATLTAWRADRPRRNPKDDPEKSGSNPTSERLPMPTLAYHTMNGYRSPAS